MSILRESTCLPRFAWRRQVIRDMQLRGFSVRTQQSYSRAVWKLAQHYHKSPDLVTDEELRQYFLYRTNVTRWSRVVCTMSLRDDPHPRDPQEARTTVTRESSTKVSHRYATASLQGRAKAHYCPGKTPNILLQGSAALSLALCPSIQELLGQPVLSSAPTNP